MSNEINWANLVAKGRAKAHGIPWSDKELLALQAGVPSDFVREGVLTMEEYQSLSKKEEAETAKTGEKKVERMNLAELKTKATELGIEFAPEATKAALVEVINNKLKEEAKDGDSKSNEDGE